MVFSRNESLSKDKARLFVRQWQLHKLRLKQIQQAKPVAGTRSLEKLPKKFPSTGRVTSENQFLLERLKQIAERTDTQRGPAGVLEPPGSLNKLIRKQEAARIAEANRKFASRLAQQTSRLSQETLEKEFQRWLAVRQMRSKSNFSLFAEPLPPLSKRKLPHWLRSSFVRRFPMKDPKPSPYLRQYMNYQHHQKPLFESLTHRPMEYSKHLKLMQVQLSNDLGMSRSGSFAKMTS